MGESKCQAQKSCVVMQIDPIEDDYMVDVLDLSCVLVKSECE
jgi:hypothetical protein